MKENDSLMQNRIVGVAEERLSREVFNYQPARNALVHEVRNPRSSQRRNNACYKKEAETNAVEYDGVTTEKSTPVNSTREN